MNKNLEDLTRLPIPVRIRRVRKAEKLTQVLFAERMEVSQSTVSRAESSGMFTLDFAEALLRHYPECFKFSELEEWLAQKGGNGLEEKPAFPEVSNDRPFLGPPISAEMHPPFGDTLDAYLLCHMGELAFHKQDVEEAKKLLERCLEAADRLRLKDIAAYAVLVRGNVDLAEDKIPEALACFSDSLRRYQEIRDDQGMALAYVSLGRAEVERHYYPRAELSLLKGYSLAVSADDEEAVAMALHHRGRVAAERNRTDSQQMADMNDPEAANIGAEAARLFYRDALRICGRLRESLRPVTLLKQLSLVEINAWLRNRERELALLNNLSLISWHLGDQKEAKALVQRAAAMYREMGDNLNLSRTLANAAYYDTLTQDYASAFRQLDEGIRICPPDNHYPYLILLEEFALLSKRVGRIELSALLYAAAEGMRRRYDVKPVEQLEPERQGYISAVKAALGEDVFSSAWAKGLTLSEDQAAQYAFSLGDCAEVRISPWGEGATALSQP
jgi:tetratricopeptide (TPR) repeat protein/DNA-binding XRE family transcriptional regulator